MIAHKILAFIVTAWLGSAPTDVREVRIAPVGEETQITVFVEGEVEVSDFMLANPARLILDLEGATLALPREIFEPIGRGGVIRIRSSQFRPDVVRLVFDLTTESDYRLSREDGAIRVSFPNPGGRFAQWSSDGPGAPPVALEGEGRPVPADLDRPEVRLEEPTVGPLAAQATQPRITVNYDSASMLDVLAGFSEFAGVSIVPNGEVSTVVVRGIDIRDQPWDVSLGAILAAQGLGWKTTESGIIIVDKLESLVARDTLLTETRILRINYGSADSVASTLEKLKSERGQVVPYAGTNSVIVTDAPSIVARMDTIVRALDKRTPQVAIEAKIVFVDRTDVLELGIVYDLKERDGGFVEQGINDVIRVPDPNLPPQLVDTDGDGIPDQAFYKRTNETLVNIGGDAVAALANANDRVLTPALQILTAVAFGEFSLFTFIEALEAQRLSDVQAAPSIRVVDNYNARIHVGEKTPIRVLERGAQVQNATINVQFEETGIILDVTPHITNNNQILLDLSAERSALAVGPSDVGFIFKKQIGTTRLLLDDGETAVIGGLTLSEVTRSTSGIPGLMNIPILGWLFRTTKEQESKTDLIILVTPHIVWPDEAPAR